MHTPIKVASLANAKAIAAKVTSNAESSLCLVKAEEYVWEQSTKLACAAVTRATVATTAKSPISKHFGGLSVQASELAVLNVASTLIATLPVEDASES